MTNDQRTIELLKWESETGIPLPMPVADILAFEDAGDVIDLATGEILLNEADTRIGLTVFGEAVAVVLAMGAGEVRS